MNYEITSAALVSSDAFSEPVHAARPIGTVSCLVLADISAILLAILTAIQIRELLLGGVLGSSFPELALTTLIFTLGSLVAARLYPGVCENPVDELRRSVLAVTLSFLSLGASTYIVRDLSQSRLIFLLTWLSCLIYVPLLRALVRSVFAGQQWWGCPVAILGMGKTGHLVYDTLIANPRLGLRPVAVLDDDADQLPRNSSGLAMGPLSSCPVITKEQKIPYGIICMPGLSRLELLRCVDLYGRCFSHILIMPDLVGMASLGVSVREVGGILGLEVTQRLLQPLNRAIKRTIDVVITLASLPVMIPVVCAAALLIRVESRGPIFYVNERIGLGGSKFRAWKLRTMVTNGEEVLEEHFQTHPHERKNWEATQKLKRDPRVTRVGRLLRKTSIDELPQLWNVICGEMSLVGPRPFLPSQIEMYGSAFELYKRVRPGLTGLWQISGRNHLTFNERVRLDVYVIQNWSVWLDIYILARTIGVVLTARGAY